jgi:2-phospho-L-lactate guanylyltransferase
VSEPAIRLLMPVRSLAAAAARLDIEPAARDDVARAVFEDTLVSALECRSVREVVVVSADPEVRSTAEQLGAEALPCEAHFTFLGVLSAAEQQLAKRPRLSSAAMVGDLPALEPHELRLALTGLSVSRPTVVVKAFNGTAATLIANRAGSVAHSLRSRSRLGRRPGLEFEVGRDLPGLRCRARSAEGLRLASYVGLGPRTTAALDRLAIPLAPFGSAS